MSLASYTSFKAAKRTLKFAKLSPALVGVWNLEPFKKVRARVHLFDLHATILTQ
jgi:hypothetical protein